MNMVKSIGLIDKYSTCPNCGSYAIGNGHGKLIVDDAGFENKFHRSCKCGWSITTDEDGNEVKEGKRF